MSPAARLSHLSRPEGVSFSGPGRERLPQDQSPCPSLHAAAADKTQLQPGPGGIVRGDNPVMDTVGNPQESVRENFKLLQGHQALAKKNLAENAAEFRALLERSREEHRQKLLQAGFNPDTPGPRLFPTPQLGPPVAEVDPQSGVFQRP